MRNPYRIKPMLNLLQLIWEQNPDMRLGQLIFNAASLGGWNNNDVFYCEDDTMEAGLVELLMGDTNARRT